MTLLTIIADLTFFESFSILFILGELYLALVLSTKAHAKIQSIDTSEALLIPGVHCYVDYNDIPSCGTNQTRIATLKDEEVFASEKVRF